MDHYPEVNVSERQCSSRQDSNASSVTKAQQTLSNKTQNGQLAAPQFTSFPPPETSTNATADQRLDRNDSGHSVSVSSEDGAKLHDLEAECNQYMDAPPPYSEKQYEGKTEDEQSKMRMSDYAKEIKRMMGRQLVSGLNRGDGGEKSP
ncbi:hypothetical protein FB567DRAFT_333562 [Paraphoma chrysanthemicola]|uniref:Uncharacterized protein n=1 Tax=Paraphoma chrysanthemicola TaxID=798071 RepID=A0A8K0R6U1_9PLEO|nr:hypothetical protein FB567DRAFT_333562 [Paraphoma chrysanthemicola]